MKSRHTLPERLLGEALASSGHHFRQHDRALPGTPDLVLDEPRLVVFVHGCFWHRHFQCARARRPRDPDFVWSRRFSETVQRDQVVLSSLRAQGWRVFVAWECEIIADPGRVGRAISAELDVWVAAAS